MTQSEKTGKLWARCQSVRWVWETYQMVHHKQWQRRILSKVETSFWNNRGELGKRSFSKRALMLHLLDCQKKRKNRYLSNWMPSVRLTMTFVKVQQTSFSNSRASWPNRQNKRYFEFFFPGVGKVPWEQYDCSFADWESWSLAFHDRCDLIFNLTIAAICLVFIGVPRCVGQSASLEGAYG